MSSGFDFSTRRGTSEFKHAILARYLPQFMVKLGTFGNEVAVIDGYAGAGVYETGEPGSPVLAASLAKRLSQTSGVKAFGICIEQEEKYFRKLDKALEPYPNWTAVPGVAADHLRESIREHRSRACFVFLDPAGLQLPFETLRDSLTIHSNKSLELMLYVSHNGLNRIIRTKGSSVDTSDRATEMLGGTWWDGLTTSEILGGYAQRVMSMGGFTFAFTIPVAERLDGIPVFYLQFFTRNPTGAWEMNNAVSMARRDRITKQTQQTLFDSGGIADQELIDRLITNTKEILRTRGEFVPQESMTELFDGVEGLARNTHVYQAFLALKAEGLIDQAPKSGDVRHSVIRQMTPH